MTMPRKLRIMLLAAVVAGLTTPAYARNACATTLTWCTPPSTR